MLTLQSQFIVCACGCGTLFTNRDAYGRPRRYVYRHYRIPISERFWDKVNKDGPIPEHCPELGPCWLWTGHIREGYGLLGAGVNRHVQAHRVSWELHFGSIPDSLCVCHRCDNPSCVNPVHFFLGSYADNFRDMREKRRHRFGEKHPSAKLTQEDVLVIRRRKQEGATFRALAKDFHVSDQSIYSIVHRAHWKHVEEVG